MDIRVLKYFLTVAKEENITRAAKALHIAQPSLSKQLIDLEQELGTKLLIRGKRKTSLTDEGNLLKERAEEIISLIEKTEHELSSKTKKVHGEIFIGAVIFTSMDSIAEISGRIHLAHPDIRYHFHISTTVDILTQIETGILDFGFLTPLPYYPIDSAKFCHLTVPVTDTLGLLMSTDHPLATHENIRPEDLNSVSLIVPEVPHFQRSLSQWMGIDLQNMNIFASCNMTYNIVPFIRKGLACVFSPSPFQIKTENGICFKPLFSAEKITYDLVWNRHQVLSKTAEIFLEHAKAFCSNPGEPASTPPQKKQ